MLWQNIYSASDKQRQGVLSSRSQHVSTVCSECVRPDDDQSMTGAYCLKIWLSGILGVRSRERWSADVFCWFINNCVEIIDRYWSLLLDTRRYFYRHVNFSYQHLFIHAQCGIVCDGDSGNNKTGLFSDTQRLVTLEMAYYLSKRILNSS